MGKAERCGIWMLTVLMDNKKILKTNETMEAAGYGEAELIQMPRFSIHKMYIQLRGVFSKVTWRRLVCNNKGSPKWIFMLRLAIHAKLLTKAKLLKWGVVQDAECSFCNTTKESVAHLMFECNISAGVWKRLLVIWQGVTRQTLNWQGEVLWASTHHKRKTPDAVYRMTMASAVYHIWQEQNARLFKQKQ
ncbi:uncharacterized protein LOC125877612 [Solanum stenotomum]|uniref:uncharacterized protein LOC125877612 n=1 Tax=Solanum stenotomum TaxID=172797 RepID=UPI0020D1AE36|nr:uncharacterized protein LOC125877612 [Solanum stenotomum]